MVGVHNLAYEFQWIRQKHTWDKVFSLAKRTPVYARTLDGVEFKCTYILTGQSLEKCGQDLTVYKVEKKVGDLDYTLPRHSRTPLTDQELGYCVGDVKVCMAVLQERMEKAGGMSKIPMTKTGYVRDYCREMCFYGGPRPKAKQPRNYLRMRYSSIMQGLQLTIPEYHQLQRAFQGGFTHANPFCVGKVIRDVTSFDFTSSYPAVMIAHRFPMSSAEEIEIHSHEELEQNLGYFCCLFDVEFHELESKIHFETYLSASRCLTLEKGVVNNGRVFSARLAVTTLTEQDWRIMKVFYRWKEARIHNFRRYRKAYLPRNFVLAVLQLYHDKTTLKGVAGREQDYSLAKSLLNSAYGMAVTDPARESWEYDGEKGWLPPKKPDLKKVLKKYNKGTGRFLFYPWGVWVCAYARARLVSGILEFGRAGDYVYSDTDSVKATHPENHQDYLEQYNSRIRTQLYQAMNYHRLPYDMVEPQTMEGERKLLGVWDWDGHYSRFKTLGAKRYMVEYAADPLNGKNQGKISITVSGLNKKAAVPWLLETFGKDGVWDAFEDEMKVPADYTGKLTHTYLDEQREGFLEDYQGTVAPFSEDTAVHLEKQPYGLGLAEEFLKFLKGHHEFQYK